MPRSAKRWVARALVVACAFWAANLAWSSSRLPVANPIVVTAAFRSVTDTVHRGQTLSELFARHGIDGSNVSRIFRDAKLEPRRVKAGQTFDFRYPVTSRHPDRASSRLDKDRVLHLARDTSGVWMSHIEAVRWTVEMGRIEGRIESSLYEALHDQIADSVLSPAELDRFIDDLADGVFSWKIDFTRDIRPGDEFRILFERLRSSLGDIRYGRLLAAKIETSGDENTAYVLTATDGRNTYYDSDGRSLRRSFKRNPVRFRRISSRFAASRLHPVLGTRRAHLGTDYAANTGTEIYATADGVVRFAGRNGGYGLMVSIRHPTGVETRYAHMSRIQKGITAGVRVKQDQRIGFVGSTGLANGPHVHYEFLKNGRHVNPGSVDLGDGTPVPAAQLPVFDENRRRYDDILRSPFLYPVAASAGND